MNNKFMGTTSWTETSFPRQLHFIYYFNLVYSYCSEVAFKLGDE